MSVLDLQGLSTAGENTVYNASTVIWPSQIGLCFDARSERPAVLGGRNNAPVAPGATY